MHGVGVEGTEQMHFHRAALGQGTDEGLRGMAAGRPEGHISLVVEVMSHGWVGSHIQNLSTPFAELKNPSRPQCIALPILRKAQMVVWQVRNVPQNISTW